MILLLAGLIALTLALSAGIIGLFVAVDLFWKWIVGDDDE